MTTRRTARNDYELDELIAVADPVRPERVDTVEPELLERLSYEVTAERRPSPRTRRPLRRRTLVLVIAVVVVASASVAGAAMFTTHTGIFGAPGMTENDTTELLRVDAPDFPPLARKLIQDIPTPPGDRPDAFLSTWIQRGIDRSKPYGLAIQAAGLRGTFALRALCSWRGYWLRARADGSTARQAAAAQGMAAVAEYMTTHHVRDSAIPQYRQAAADEARGSLGSQAMQALFASDGCIDLVTAELTR